jgi:hypothetical protein
VGGDAYWDLASGGTVDGGGIIEHVHVPQSVQEEAADDELRSIGVRETQARREERRTMTVLVTRRKRGYSFQSLESWFMNRLRKEIGPGTTMAVHMSSSAIKMTKTMDHWFMFSARKLVKLWVLSSTGVASIWMCCSGWRKPGGMVVLAMVRDE